MSNFSMSLYNTANQGRGMTFSLKTYKTKKCQGGCSASLSWLIDCPFYHSLKDYRRPNFNNYSNILLSSLEEENGHCNNMIEYLFHPQNYKRLLCQSRGCRFDLETWEFCPFLHIEQKPADSSACSSTQGSQVQSDKPRNSQKLSFRNLISLQEDKHHQFKCFKDLYSHEHWEKILISICAFANCQGGRIYLGVGDDHTILGYCLSSAGRSQFMHKLNQQLSSKFQPALSLQEVKISFQSVLNKVEQYIIVLEVRPIKIAGRLVFYRNKIYMRRLASSVKLHGQQIWDILEDRRRNEEGQQIASRNSLSSQESNKNNSRLTTFR